MKTLQTALFLAVGASGLALSSGTASANAFNVNEHDAQVSGRGGASAASNTSPSSIIFNPGGIAMSQGTAVAINGSLYIAQGSYERADGTMKTETDSDPSAVPSVYVTSRVHDMVAVGIGFHLPFGLALSWPDNHEQAGVIQDQALRTYFITPSVGINLNKQVPGLAIGGGIDLVPATVLLERAVEFGETKGTAQLGGEAFGVGGRFGVMYHSPDVKGLKLGVMYRSKVTLDFEGKGDFDIADPYRDALPPDGDISTSITLPQSVWGGVAYSPIPALELEANLVWIGWDSFEELRINLPDGSASVAPQNYENTTTFRVGAEYKLEAQKAAIRAGFVYDPTPIPNSTQSAQLPDVDRKNISLGASKAFGNYAAHLGFLWVTPGERETSDEMPYAPQYKGTYGVQAFVTSLMFSGQFGQ